MRFVLIVTQSLLRNRHGKNWRALCAYSDTEFTTKSIWEKLAGVIFANAGDLDLIRVVSTVRGPRTTFAKFA